MLAAAAARLGQLAGQLVWWVFIVIRWAHANFVARPCDFFLDSVLGSWEEAVRVSVRESFAWMARAINGLSAQAVSLFVDPNYYDSMRAGRRRPTAWQASCGLLAALPPPCSLARVFGSSERLLYEQQQRQTEILLAAERLHAAGGILALPRRRRRWLGFLRWPFGKWRAAGSSSHGNSHEKLGSSPGLSPPRMRRSGSELFDRPSGYAMAEGMQRRGLLEEGRIALELAVTIVFDAVRTSVRALLLLRKRPKWEPAGGYHGSSWFSDWTGGERRATRGRARQRSLRAARTRSFGVLEDLQVWTAGYPLEEHVVTTEDGCILHMQRIPRKGSRDTVFFQHGVLDTSLGWVSNGIQGSQAFAAWDQGHDVWLGNARSNPPRMHANPRLGGSRYWNYSLNELGTQDIAAQIAQIHAVKMRELRPGSGYGQAGGAMERAASLGAPAGAVGHSLGGASLLIYAVYCGLAGRPHHLRRMVLLTPAGYHANYPSAAFPFVYLVPLLMAGLSWVLPGVGAPVYIPSSLLRYIAFKFSHDLQQIPGLNELIRAALRLMLNGDKSEWDRALQMPHYNTYGMPAISLHTGAHLIQLIRTRRFLMYNYGSAAANRAAYGQDTPLDVAASYGLLQGLPVDLVAGGSDGIIAEVDVHSHYEAMRAAGVQVTFKRFQNVGHLDVTFGMKEEIRRYVISRLLLP
ncbi:hypothetical protein CHLNCDRAFT_53131 [Chlorella variabilis]|uniref:Partial AB-hydrolase lipase domain-containing protein n=1 Tax=Chlorella variabilis TaxID=554065 RepID=E1ZIE3_CHLVA|nr:hypothetical protein CHLNCDRAFT_53131 [Chlorella variabilis]EFN54144.1 hypothetical protein CHLNCDRAFT_53131 [Chlorella variabilis]|eukprot:XP_005846246.1 hypothetical protein CHLNCDRAFT_53131 [Chlorella variabilis]